MNETLPLTERLKQQMQQEQETTLALMRERMSTIESESSATLQNALNTIKNDTAHQLSEFRKFHKNKLQNTLQTPTLLWPIAIPVSVCLGLFLASLGLANYSSHQLQTIQQHRQTINQLAQEGGNLILSRCGDRMCAEIDLTATEYGQNREFRILKQRN